MSFLVTTVDEFLNSRQLDGRSSELFTSLRMIAVVPGLWFHQH